MLESSSLYEAPGPHVSAFLGHGDAYVLSLANLRSAYAALASSPSHRIDLLDKGSLRRIQTLPGHDLATTSIRVVESLAGFPNGALLSSGRDGLVKVWDDRSGSQAVRLKNPEDILRAVLCCDASSDGNIVAAGTELADEDAFILYWDPRQPRAPLYEHASTHSDDITTLSFQPTVSSPLVLSGSSDGLLAISDATEKDEDDAILHVRSWNTSISQAGWYCSSADVSSFGVWAASDMETFSLWSDELDQLLSLDIRSPSVHTQSRTWVTDYLIACLPRQEGLRLYVGSNEGDAAFITPPGLSSPKPPTKSIGNWVLHSLWKNSHTGIIRSILPDDENQVIVTGGEDGKIQMWKNSPLDSPGFKDVDGDVEMMVAPEAYPLSYKNRKRIHDEDEILTGKKLRYQ